MFLKTLLVLCSVCALGIEARPSYLPSYQPSYQPSYHSIEYAPTVLGYESLAVPAAVSHQSSTVVHEKRPYLRPIIEHHAPVLATTSYSASPSYTTSYDSSPLSYGSGWYEPGWNSGLSSYPSIYLK